MEDSNQRAPLLQVVRELGATEAAIIPSAEIVTRERLAALCVEPRCPNYGLATSCPPHVSGPEGFQALQSEYPHALVYKLDLDTGIMLSPEVRDTMRLMHEMAAAVERAAPGHGFPRARGFVGGSCKTLFCDDHADCSALTEGGKCRHPDLTHPSVSGYGIDTQALIQAAGWKMHRVEPGTQPPPDSLGTLCGLVLLAVS